MNYCRGCGRGSRGAGYREDDETGMWVCVSCGNPTRMFFERSVERGDIRLLVVTPEQFATGYQRIRLRDGEITHHRFRKVRDDENGNVVVVTPREGYDAL